MLCDGNFADTRKEVRLSGSRWGTLPTGLPPSVVVSQERGQLVQGGGARKADFPRTGQQDSISTLNGDGREEIDLQSQSLGIRSRSGLGPKYPRPFPQPRFRGRLIPICADSGRGFRFMTLYKGVYENSYPLPVSLPHAHTRDHGPTQRSHLYHREQEDEVGPRRSRGQGGLRQRQPLERGRHPEGTIRSFPHPRRSSNLVSASQWMLSRGQDGLWTLQNARNGKFLSIQGLNTNDGDAVIAKHGDSQVCRWSIIPEDSMSFR